MAPSCTVFDALVAATIPTLPSSGTGYHGDLTYDPHGQTPVAAWRSPQDSVSAKAMLHHQSDELVRHDGILGLF